MSDIMEKTLNSVSNFFTGNFGPRNLDISPGFDQLLQTVKRSGKVEVDRIIEKQIDLLKKKLSQPDNGVHKIKEYIVRILYCEMLGHNTTACHIHAVKLSQQANLQEKRIGYLAICVLLHENHELLVLMVNTFQRDLKSTNFLEVCMALTAVSYLGTADMIPVLLPLIENLSTHPRDVVRKKAVMALFSFYRKSPMLMVQSYDLFKKALCDSKPAVMSAALHVFKFFIKEDCDKYKDIVPSLVKILHQIVHHKLHQDFNFNGIPAPWTQINILKMMSTLGQGDKKTSSLMHDVLCDVLQQTKQPSSISYALQYECIMTITKIECTQEMLAACSKCIDKFLKSSNHNLKYLGITALSCIVQVDATHAGKHQMVVIDCLNDSDNTIQIKTLELLYKMCNSSNVDVICNQYLEYLENNKDVYIKKTILQRIFEMANNYGQKCMWYVDTVNKVLLIAGDQVNVQQRNQIITQIKDIGRWKDADAVHMQALQVYYQLLCATTIQSQALFQIAVWVVGEFWQPEIGAPVQEVLDLLCKLLTACSDCSIHSSWLVTSLGKVLCKSKVTQIPEVLENKMNTSNVETRQRIFELNELCQDVELVENVGLATQQLTNEVDSTLSFLDEYVSDALDEGATPYIPRQQRHTERNRRVVSATLLGGLKFEPYQSPTTSLASTSTPPKSFNILDNTSTQGSDNSSKPDESTDSLQLGDVRQVWNKKGYVKTSVTKISIEVESNTDISNQDSTVFQPMSKSKVKAPAMLSSASASAIQSEESVTNQEKQLLADKLFGGMSNQQVDNGISIRSLDEVDRNTDRLVDKDVTMITDLNLLDLDNDRKLDPESYEQDVSHDNSQHSHDETMISHENNRVVHDLNIVSHDDMLHATSNIPHDLFNASHYTDKQLDIEENMNIVEEINIPKQNSIANMPDSDAIGSFDKSLPNLMYLAESEKSAIIPNANLATNNHTHLLDKDDDVIPAIPESLKCYPSSSTHHELCMNDVMSLRMCRIWKPDCFVVIFFLVNKSRNFNVTDIEIILNCPSNLKCSINDQEINKWNMESLSPSSVENIAIYFKYKSPSLNMNLGGHLCFRDTNKKQQKLFFSTDITLTDFIRPLQLTTDEFGKKWQSSMLESKLNIEKSRWKNIEQLLEALTTKLNFHQVQIIGEEGIASGSILDSTPCLLHVNFNVKSIQLWFRTTSKLMAECLVQETKKLFK
ncbi:AP-4 complex subunit epsilon-1-like [Antedon mediterranea]|uniref:AP-4 complex subunit epsilon-1-like n=1 Tax=Antedon mediterranea TaxID=105859 RepID=UPI003AF718E6